LIAAVVIVLVSIIPALMLGEVIADWRRLAKWMRRRSPVDDTQFVTALGTVNASKESVLRVRQEIARATKIPAEWISANDQIQELERVGRTTHSSVLDYFTDLLFVGDPKDESALITVRDFVIRFAPQLKEPLKT